MNTLGNQKLLRIFMGESAHWNHQPLYEAIVIKARDLGLAGATVLRSPMGFGRKHHIHTAKVLRLSEDLPIVIEIVDEESKLQQLLPELKQMMKHGLVTIQDVNILYAGSEIQK